MTIFNLPLYLILVLSVLFSLVFTFIAFRARKVVPGGHWVAMVGLSVSIWSAGYLLELLVGGLQAKLFWANMKQIGNVLLPMSFLLFSLRYTQFMPRINKRLFALLSIEPSVVLFLYWTDGQYHLMRLYPRLVNFIDVRLLAFEFGQGLYWHFTYSAILTSVGTALLLVRFLRTAGVYRTQILFVLFGMAIPFAGATATFLGWIPTHFDATPLLLGFSFPVMALGLFRYSFFKMIPVDNQSILDNLPLGMMVLDLTAEERINALNPVAREILQTSTSRALGKSIKDFIPEWDYDPRTETSTQDFELTLGERTYAVSSSKISDEDDPLELWLILFRDLTEQRRLQASLSASEEKYRSLVEHSMDGIGIIQDGVIRYCNPQLAVMVGYHIEDVVNKPYLNFFTRKVRVLESNQGEQRSASDEPDTLHEVRLIHKDGHTLPVEISTASVEYDKYTAYLIIVRDISARKLAEEQRERTLALLEATIRSSPSGILVLDAQENVLAINERFLEIWGLPDNWDSAYPAEERLEMMLKKVTDRDQMFQGARELLRDLEREDLMRTRLVDGRMIERLSRPFYVQNKLVGRLYLYTDITEQIQYEEQLKASEEKYRLLAENASDVIWTVDLNGKFTYVSPSVAKLRGYTVEEVIQQSLDEALTPDSHRVVMQAMQDIYQAMAEKKDLADINNRFNLEQPCKDGSTVWTEVETSIMLDAEGQVTGVQGVSRDITERRLYEKELEEARMLAEEQSTEVQKALKREQQLHAITRTISSSMELETILSELLSQTLDITDADEAHLGLMSEDGLQVHYQYGMNRQEGYSLDVKIPRERNNFSWAVVDRRKGLLLDSWEDIEAVGLDTADLREMNITSLLAVPVMAGLSVLGVLVVFSKAKQKKFDEHDLTMLESIGTQAGIAIQNAHLFAEVNLLAITDPLTRLYNRRYFFDLARLELERSRRYKSDMAFVMIDIDLFKQINDTYGHLVGDEVLISVADNIRKNLRQVDLAARYGGEEMVVMLPQTSTPEALVLAERLRKTIENTKIHIGKHLVSTTVSIGVSSLDDQVDITVSKLLDQADQAMYAAKESGRNQVDDWFSMQKKKESGG